MADLKVTALTAITTPVPTDLIYIVADPGTTPLDRKCTLANLKTALAVPISVGVYLITETVAGVGGVANFDFISIPSTYRNLRIVFQGRGEVAATETEVTIKFNNDGSSIYDYQQQVCYSTNNAAGYAAADQAAGRIALMAGASAPAGECSQFTADIANYKGATFDKTYFSTVAHRLGTGATNYRLANFCGFWRSTAAITRVTLTPTSGDFAEGSVCSLYGVM